VCYDTLHLCFLDALIPISYFVYVSLLERVVLVRSYQRIYGYRGMNVRLMKSVYLFVSGICLYQVLEDIYTSELY